MGAQLYVSLEDIYENNYVANSKNESTKSILKWMKKKSILYSETDGVIF